MANKRKARLGESRTRLSILIHQPLNLFAPPRWEKKRKHREVTVGRGSFGVDLGWLGAVSKHLHATRNFACPVANVANSVDHENDMFNVISRLRVESLISGEWAICAELVYIIK
jgi:hypothetical protein